MIRILLILLLFPSIAFASAIWGTVSGDVSGDVEVDFYRTECADDVLEHTILTSPGGFYYYSFNKTGIFTVVPSKDGYTVEPESREYLIPDLTTTIANVDFVTTEIPPVITERFTDNGDGTIFDNATKLTWLKDANCFGANEHGLTAIAIKTLGSGMCGLTDNSSACDWYLPSWAQLQRLGTDPPVIYLPSNPNTGFVWKINDVGFINVQAGGYWTTNGVVDRPLDKRFIDMTTGFIWVNTFTEHYYGMAVKR